jgi:hypothetical protein
MFYKIMWFIMSGVYLVGKIEAECISNGVTQTGMG